MFYAWLVCNLNWWRQIKQHQKKSKIKSCQTTDPGNTTTTTNDNATTTITTTNNSKNNYYYNYV